MGDKGKKDREKIRRQKLKKKNDKTENARKKQEKDAPLLTKNSTLLAREN